MKKLLVQEEAMIPALFYNLKRALIPLLDDSTYVTMQAVAASAEARGRSGKDRLPSKKQDQEKHNEENKRKRSLESGGLGSGPGLFGQNSNLTNGKKETQTTCISVEKMSEMAKSSSSPTWKRNKSDSAKIEDDGGDDDSDGDAHDDKNICTSSYCPPCYELA